MDKQGAVIETIVSAALEPRGRGKDSSSEVRKTEPTYWRELPGLPSFILRAAWFMLLVAIRSSLAYLVEPSPPKPACRSMLPTKEGAKA